MRASPELLEAYLSTRYLVVEDGASGAVEVMVGSRSPAIDAVLARYGARSGVFITAWNPRSRPRPRSVNEADQRRLEADLRARAIDCLPHRGVAADPSWESERGVLALDLSVEDALGLAEAYGQNAVVVVDLGEPARLVLTAHMPIG
jgi:hypothetical protein